MNNDDIEVALTAVRLARLTLLAKPGNLAELKRHIELVDCQDTRRVLRRQLADDLRAMRALGMGIPRTPGNETFPTA